MVATVPGTRRSEVPRTLREPVPQPLGWIDQTGLWTNLGVSLLGFTGAIFVLQPGGDGTPKLALTAAITAIVIGTIIGTLAVAISGVPGALTGAPAMVLLRGLFGARLSYAPTLLNVLQCIGWGTFELVTIATAANTVAPGLPYSVAVLIAGAITTLLTLRPLGAVRIFRRYVMVAVVIVLAYLFIELLRHPLPSFTSGTWSGYWPAMDTTVAVAVSFVPLASDYTRHTKSPRAAFGGTLFGYGIAQIACYLLGLLALITVARTSDDIYAAFIAVPLGSVAFAILATREIDQSFANVYSTAVSMQNFRPGWDRRILAAAIGILTTALALWFNISDYQDFLLLIGSVFVPMFGVLAVDFFILSHRHWDLSERSRARWRTVIAWAAGFVTYQLINPGLVDWWASFWENVATALHFTPASWMSATLCSLVVSAVIALVLGWLPNLRRA